jgi:hypothetical protein
MCVQRGLAFDLSLQSQIYDAAPFLFISYAQNLATQSINWIFIRIDDIGKY